MTWKVQTQFNTLCKAVDSAVPEWCAVVVDTKEEADSWLDCVLKGRHFNRRVVTLWENDVVVKTFFL